MQNKYYSERHRAINERETKEHLEERDKKKLNADKVQQEENGGNSTRQLDGERSSLWPVSLGATRHKSSPVTTLHPLQPLFWYRIAKHVSPRKKICRYK